VNVVNMSLFGFMVRHTGESRYPGFFIFSAGPGFLLEFTPYLIRGRNDRFDATLYVKKCWTHYTRFRACR
jgi:hypothetical protein